MWPRKRILAPVLAPVLALALVGAGGPSPVAAQQASALSDYKPKRLKPPPPGTTRRITVQIDPEEQARILNQQNQARRALAQPDAAEAPGGTPGAVAAAVGSYGWFWDKVSPTLAASGPGRLDAAMRTLASRGEVGAPRLQTLQDIARSQGVPILTSTIGTNVSPALVLAVIAVESAGRADAVSRAGATGLMQLMPATAARFGVKDSLVPAENIAGGVKYLDWLMGHFDNDPILVLAGYNAGEGAVRDHAGVPPFPETRDYVPKVLAAFQLAKGLCRTPPELISDGCVFVAMN